MSTAITEVQTAVAEFDKVAASIAELKKKYAGVVFDVRTAKGMEEAKKARSAVREPRYEIERVRKAAKAPILKLGKELDDRAKAITSEILAIESPIDEQIKNEEARKEREKQAKIEAELKRVADLQERVAELRGNQMLTPASGSATIAEHMADLERIPVDESFEEFQQQATDAKSAGIARLNDLYAAAVAHEAEQERIKAEREELARLRAEEGKRLAAERERLAEEERKAKAERDAEAAKQAEALRKEREEIAKARAEEEQRQAEARAKLEEEQRLAREKQAAEEHRLAQERADLQRKQEAARRAEEEVERQKREQARLASIKKPSDAELIQVLADHYSVPASKVVEWLAAVNLQKVAA